jgi:hypothetical protein
MKRGTRRRGPAKRSPYDLFLHGNDGKARRDLMVLAGLAVALALTSWTSYHLGYGWGQGSPKVGGDVTFKDILDGKVATASTKWGDGGTIVTVHHVVIHSQTQEADGDWFWSASDPTYQNGDFVLEVIHRDQAGVHRAPLNVPLTITGVPYCDLVHGEEDQGHGSGERWHTGGSCWELHPLYSWSTELLGVA